jgi:acetyl esterase/lipase
MRSALLLAACCAIQAIADAQTPSDPTKIPVFYSVRGMDAVRVERDLTFRTVGDTELKADIYRPAKAGTHPVVLLVSGGAVHDWRTAAFYTSFARVLAAEGVAAVSFDKRFSRESASAQTASDDTFALVEFLRGNASRYGLDISRLCSWHFSAGGRVAGAMLGEKSPASCVIVTYAILSFGDEGDKDPKLAPYSALAQVAARGDRIPPTLVVRAGRDDKMLNDRVDAFVGAALAKNAPVTLINYPAGAHGFEIADDTDETRRVIARSIEWLKAHVAPR